MSVVFPAPVGPTIATFFRGNAEGEAAQHRGVVRVVEAHVVEYELGGGGERRGRDRGDGETMLTFSSISLKIRSVAAMADCRRLNFSAS